MRRLKGNLSVSFINKTFFPEYLDVKVINEGECFLWAYIAYRLYKEVELWDMGSHAFIRSKRTGRFYDSESPRGKKDWKELRATNFGYGCGCSMCQRPARKFKTAGKFRSSWRGMQKRFGTDYQKLHEQIKRVIEKRA